MDGGTGLDTFNTTGMIGANIEGTGTGTVTGTVINLGTTAISNIAVDNVSAEFLPAGLTSVPGGTVAYQFGSGTLNTDSTVTTTITNVENIVLAANGANYVAGSTGADSVQIGTGVDYVTLGKGNDAVTGVVGSLTTADFLLLGTGTNTVTFTNAAFTSTIDDSVGVSSVTVTTTASTDNPTVVLSFTATNTTDTSFDLSTLVAGEDSTVTLSDAQAAGDYTVVTCAGADTIAGGVGANTITGGLGRDLMSGNTAADTYIFATRVETSNSKAAGDINANKIDSITNYSIALDTIQLGLGTNAFGAALTFTGATTAVIAGTVALSANLANLGAVMTAVEAAQAGIASTPANAHVTIVTIAATASIGSDFDTNSAGTYMVINDNIAALAETDTIINITGLTGTIVAADLTFV